MIVYADSSFFVSIYLEDTHSHAAENLVDSGARIWFSRLHYAECTHAIAQQVFQKNISAMVAQQAHLDLEGDRAAGLWVVTELPETSFELCADLARRYGSRLGVRTLDSLHVACALQLKAQQFWTFDERQARLAKAVGLNIP